LGGVSASLAQAYPPERVQVPLLAVFPYEACYTFRNCTKFLAITVQIPYELVPNNPRVLGAIPNFAMITATDGESTTLGIELNPVFTQIRVVRNGDEALADGSAVVTHADATLVSQENPARVGEVLVLYAFGLGRTDEAAKTGAASPLRAQSISLPLVFDFRPNATPSAMLLDDTLTDRPRPGSSVQAVSLFAGLSPGSVGLYQVNFRVPAPPSALPPCGGSVRSNLTVNLIGTSASPSSFDGAGICVDLQSDTQGPFKR
jgi:hypothetical protein